MPRQNRPMRVRLSKSFSFLELDNRARGRRRGLGSNPVGSFFGADGRHPCSNRRPRRLPPIFTSFRCVSSEALKRGWSLILGTKAATSRKTWADSGRERPRPRPCRAALISTPVAVWSSIPMDNPAVPFPSCWRALPTPLASSIPPPGGEPGCNRTGPDSFTTWF